MKITDKELNVKNILDVRRGSLPRGKRRCLSRHSDSFVFVTSGSAQYLFDDKLLNASAGDVLFLSYKSQYSINVNSDDYRFIYVNYFFDLQSEEHLTNFIYKTKHLSALEQDFKNLYNLWKIGDYADKLYCRALVYKIYSQLAKSDMTHYISGNRRREIEQIAEYMSEHLSEADLSVTDLCKLCRISEVHFRRLFNCIYHTSPTKFLTSLRIKKAKELLSNNNYSISEISELCGFQNHYYFSKVFKSMTSTTPTEYRRGYSELL